MIFFYKKVKRTAFMKKKHVTIFNAIQKLGVKIFFFKKLIILFRRDVSQ